MFERVPIRKALGKTLRAIGGQECGEVLILVWSDDTFSAVRGGSTDNFDWYDFEIGLESHAAYGSSQLWWPVKLVELGIVTAEEVKESEAKVKAALAKKTEDEERRRYEELRKKFDAQTVPS